MKKMINEKSPGAGFTLIELLVVVLLISLLAAVSVPAFQGYVARGHRLQAQAELAQLVTHISLLRARSATGVVNTRLDPQALLQGPLQRYTLKIQPNPIGSQATFWVSAIPKKNSPQAGDGGLSLTHDGSGCWHKLTDEPRDWLCAAHDESW